MADKIFYFIRYFTFLGNFLPQFTLSILLLFIDFPTGFKVGATWGWGVIINFTIKNLVKKKRPNIGNWKIAHVNGHSFPSGHSLTSLVIYWSLAEQFQLGLALTIFLYLIPFALGLSRLYLKVHDPIDVYAGWAIAFIYLRTLSNEAIAITRPVFMFFFKLLGIELDF